MPPNFSSLSFPLSLCNHVADLDIFDQILKQSVRCLQDLEDNDDDEALDDQVENKFVPICSAGDLSFGILSSKNGFLENKLLRLLLRHMQRSQRHRVVSRSTSLGLRTRLWPICSGPALGRGSTRSELTNARPEFGERWEDLVDSGSSCASCILSLSKVLPTIVLIDDYVSHNHNQLLSSSSFKVRQLVAGYSLSISICS